jgi:hypothetical protein
VPASFAIARKEAPRADASPPLAGAKDAVERARQTGGAPLPAELRRRLEHRVGRDLAHVTVHTGEESAEAAAAVHARAFAVGAQIHFARGQYHPGDPEGDRLIAHEVVHTVQAQGAAPSAELELSEPGDASEREADTIADAFVSGDAASAPPGAAPVATVSRAIVQRESPVSPEDLRRIARAELVLKTVPPMAAADRQRLEHAAGEAPIFLMIEERTKKTKALDELKAQFQEYQYNHGSDECGPPSDAEKADVKRQTDAIAALTAEVEQLTSTIDAAAAALGTTADDIANYFTVELPEKFMARGQQIALAQLEVNRKLVVAELQKYGIGEDAADPANVAASCAGLRAAAADLAERKRQIDEDELVLQEAQKAKLPGGAPTPPPPPPVDPDQDGGAPLPPPPPAPGGSSAYDVAHEHEIRARLEGRRAELQKSHAGYALKYRALYRISADEYEEVAGASDDRLREIVGGKGTEILDKITKTKKNIEGGKLKIWSIPEVVETTKADMAIASSPTLERIVDKKVADEAAIEKGKQEVVDGLLALVMVAGVIASIVTLNPGPAIATGLIVGAIDVARAWDQVDVASDAQDTEFDDALAKMTNEDPDYAWLAVSIATFVLSAVEAVGAAAKAAKAARLKQAYTALKGNTTLETFSRAARAMYPAQADALIAQAAAHLKNGLKLDSQIAAIGARFSQESEAMIGSLLAKCAQEEYTQAYMRLLRTGKVMPLTQENLIQALGDPIGRNIWKLTTAKGSLGIAIDGTIFIKPGTTLAEAGDIAAHELVHSLQQSFGKESPLLSRIGFNPKFYEEYQASLGQQRFLSNVLDEFGEDAFRGLDPATREHYEWLAKAKPEEIRDRVLKTYQHQGAQLHPTYGFDPQQIEEELGKLVDAQAAEFDKELQKQLAKTYPPP